MTCRCADSTPDDGNNCNTCSNNGGGGGGGGGGVRLFGVQLTDGSIMKKSASTGNLSSGHNPVAGRGSDWCHGDNLAKRAKKSASMDNLLSYASASSSSSDCNQTAAAHVSEGYHTDNPASATNRRSDRKKAVAWTEQEHQLFLKGLQELGKGDWRGISKKFVTSRNSTQVASHAQKYFFRHSNLNRRKKRASLFDMVSDPPIDADSSTTEDQSLVPHQVQETNKTDSLPSLNLSLQPVKSLDKTSNESVQIVQRSSNMPPLAPKFVYTGYIPVTIPIWPQFTVPTQELRAERSHHHVLKPIPNRPTQHVNVDGLARMAQLNLGNTDHFHKENSPSGFNSRTESRQSAFHTNSQSSDESASRVGNQFELGNKGTFFFI